MGGEGKGMETCKIVDLTTEQSPLTMNDTCIFCMVL